jgi:hypothetical protein
MVVLAISVLRHNYVTIFPSRQVGVAAIVFLGSITGSLFVTPVPVDGFLTFLQYGLVFAVVIPGYLYVFREERTRRYAVMGLAVVLNVIALQTTYVSVWLGKTNISFWFGNTNQLYWVVATAFIVDGILAFEPEYEPYQRVLLAALSLLAGATTLQSRAASAILMIGVGAWFMTLYIVTERVGDTGVRAFVSGTALAAVVGVAFVVTNLEFIESSFEAAIVPRLIQYRNGIRLGVTHLPFGTGIESAEIVFRQQGLRLTYPIHNAFVSYFLEIGVFGFFGYTLLVLYWTRDVLVRSILDRSRQASYRIAVAIFGAQLAGVALFQPVPPRRFWWLFFALGFAVAIEGEETTASTSPEK